MYSANVVSVMNTQKFFAAGIKLYEYLKQAVKPEVSRPRENKECMSFLLNAVIKGQTVLDIGSHNRQYLFDLLKLSKHRGNILAFDSNFDVCSCLVTIKQLLGVQNVTI